MPCRADDFGYGQLCLVCVLSSPWALKIRYSICVLFLGRMGVDHRWMHMSNFCWLLRRLPGLNAVLMFRE